MTEDIGMTVAVVEEEGSVWVKVTMGDVYWVRGDAENARQLAQDLLVAAADLEHGHARRRLVLVKR